MAVELVLHYNREHSYHMSMDEPEERRTSKNISIQNTYRNCFDDWLRTLATTMDRDVPFIPVSLRTRRICNQYFEFRDSLRTVPDCFVPAKAEQWQIHLNDSSATRVLNRKSQFTAQGINRSVLARLEMRVIYYDYDRQLSLPMMSEQTMNEWLAEKMLRRLAVWNCRRGYSPTWKAV